MSGIILLKLAELVESMGKRMEVMDAENAASQAVLMSIISTMSNEQAQAIKQHLDAVTSHVDEMGIDEKPEIAEARKAFYQRIFSGLN